MVQKQTKESNKVCKLYGTIDLRLLLVEVNCIFHFTILLIERSNCFNIINSFCSTGMLTS